MDCLKLAIWVLSQSTRPALSHPGQSGPLRNQLACIWQLSYIPVSTYFAINTTKYLKYLHFRQSVPFFSAYCFRYLSNFRMSSQVTTDEDRLRKHLRLPGRHFLSRKGPINRYHEALRKKTPSTPQQVFYPSKSTTEFLFFELPMELRLYIYEYCSALALLQLTHTCRQLRAEVRSHPSIIKRSHGYLSLWLRPGGKFWGRGLTKPWSWKFGLEDDPLVYDGRALSIRHISVLQDLQEVELWNRLYDAPRPAESKPIARISYFSDDQLEGQDERTFLRTVQHHSFPYSESERRRVCEMCRVVKREEYFREVTRPQPYLDWGPLTFGDVWVPVCFTCMFTTLSGSQRKLEEGRFSGVGIWQWTERRVYRWTAPFLRISYQHGVKDNEMRVPTDCWM
ncbi:hypothetical protein BJ508DRAFT_156658 [Ascobolus immersus RN42]|uniref:F-box domain-containing protein n=1 Tax=Ascobolus immersus RN42 TaxID=1160509 RepID=A0A3N4HYK2_ASCIM|nr:hypothetical protein BJ508DRAFT_156658 [Ascobolus immersus RN42]